MRLNVYISSSGWCSRRRADQYIKAGQVTVNGQVVTRRMMVALSDQVAVQGVVVQPKEHNVYLLLHKPRGIICTAAKDVKENVIDYIGYPERIFPVGRLDNQSEGLLLLTNDGAIVNELLKREARVEKDYVVTVNRIITEQFIQELSEGVRIYNPREKGYTITRPCTVVQLSDVQFKITLTEGMNRQIRRMCRRFQYTVTTLQRVRLKDLHLGEVAVGEWRYLTMEEVEGLQS